ncbi:hypothetical protein AJ87_23365 [Rhizobium yanglingense]|nr:hypothetical protein AJ87_23365 [Rhizobium yanglingense]
MSCRSEIRSLGSELQEDIDGVIVVPLLPCLKRSLILTLAKRFLTALDRHRQPDLVAISEAVFT